MWKKGNKKKEKSYTDPNFKGIEWFTFNPFSKLREEEGETEKEDKNETKSKDKEKRRKKERKERRGGEGKRKCIVHIVLKEEQPLDPEGTYTNRTKDKRISIAETRWDLSNFLMKSR
jgi:hypothetical protein